MQLDALARRQYGIVTAAQALRHGSTYSALDWFACASAAVLRSGSGAALSGTSAAFVHGLQDTPPAIAAGAETGAEVDYVRRVEQAHGLPAARLQVVADLPAAGCDGTPSTTCGASWSRSTAPSTSTQRSDGTTSVEIGRPQPRAG